MARGETSMQQQINAASRLVFLFEKKLSKTDVCPKRKEILLPRRAAMDGLPFLMGPNNSMMLPMRDLKTEEVWRFKYKFWPRSSGSYLLAHTGHFVVQHKLEDGDIIKLYKDRHDNQFVIEAVKINQPSRGSTAPPATIARRSLTKPIRRLWRSPIYEVLPHGFI